VPLGDTTEFQNPYLREVYVRELAVGEVGDGARRGPRDSRRLERHFRLVTRQTMSGSTVWRQCIVDIGSPTTDLALNWSYDIQLPASDSPLFK